MSVPNQKLVRIYNERVGKYKDTERIYTLLYNDTIYEAMKKLSLPAFKVYMYLCINKENFLVSFSPCYIQQLTNMCKETVRKAFKELLTAGYIIQYKETNNTYYTFLSNPKMLEQNVYLTEEEQNAIRN